MNEQNTPEYNSEASTVLYDRSVRWIFIMNFFVILTVDMTYRLIRGIAVDDKFHYLPAAIMVAALLGLALTFLYGKKDKG